MTITLSSPLSGWLTSLDDVPDPVFRDRLLGPGVAIDPVDAVLRAPGPAVVANLHPAGHAVTLELDGGAVLLMHIGLETVGLEGAGFTAHVREGERVGTGDPLIGFDLDHLARNAVSVVTPIILTNSEDFDLLAVETGRAIAAGAPLLTLRPRGEAQQEEKAETGPSVARSLRLPLRHGIHARPAARIAALAKQYQADIVLQGEEGKSASARSAVAMLALALRHGALVHVRGSGADAEAGVDAVVALIESGMDEFAPVAAERVEAAPEPQELLGALPAELSGVCAAPGLAIGESFGLRRQRIEVPRDGAGSSVERAALDAARDKVRVALEREAASDNAVQSGIAAAHLAFLDDPELVGAAGRAIEAGRSAGAAWQEAIQGFVDALAGSGEARFAERADDLFDLEERLLAALTGRDPGVSVPPGAILLAEDLLPSQLMAMADAGLAGIATGKGGPTSHVAIIAGSLGLPMLVALGPALDRIQNRTPLILDAAGGTLAINPPTHIIAETQRRAQLRAERRAVAQARRHDACRMADGTRIELFANLGALADAHRAVEAGAEGCGLLRTEFLFLDRATPPDEAEQRAAYQAIADALDGRPLIVRTLDVGGDKAAPYLALPAEENPALGLRGLRVGLWREDLLLTQFRALLGVRARGPLRIMLPMVADLGEMRSARVLLDRAGRELGVEAVPELGIMIETPAAAMTADLLAAEAAFFSVGTNDLSQYTLARDRGNPAVAAGLDPLHPAILRLIAATAKGGQAHGRWTGVCGGLAADPLAAAILIGLGVSELSVPPGRVAETKALVRGLSMAECRTLAERACAAPDAAAVRQLALAMETMP